MFTTPRGNAISDGNLRRRVLAPAADPVGVSWVTFHTFRHTCASLLFEAGRDVKQVAAWLGHADASFTLKTYISLIDDGVGDAEFLDDAVRVGNAWATEHPQPADARSTEKAS
ncbi:MAG: tyrosine-type recombinase/integrase [Solirubrobacterales bacterium]